MMTRAAAAAANNKKKKHAPGETDPTTPMTDEMDANNPNVSAHVVVLSAHNIAQINQQIASCSRRRDVVRAMKIFEQLLVAQQRFKPTLDTFRSLMRVFMDARSEKILLVYEAVMRLGMTPDMDMHLMLMRVYSHLNSMPKVMRVFSKLREQGKLTPNLPLYEKLLEFCANCGDITVALEIFDLMLSDGLRPGLVAYNQLMRCFAVNGDPRTFLLFEEMKNRGLEYDETTYNNLILASARTGNLAEAKRLVREMRRHGFVPNVTSHTIIFNTWYKQNQHRIIKKLGVYSNMFNIQPPAPLSQPPQPYQFPSGAQYPNYQQQQHQHQNNADVASSSEKSNQEPGN